ncbi:hypothetical protein B0H19DRAFT_576329 [Mycena capillaripes]|nr:hypothetical protein B0H19DRAFT_576329 [Mycena capillaripes]
MIRIFGVAPTLLTFPELPLGAPRLTASSSASSLSSLRHRAMDITAGRGNRDDTNSLQRRPTARQETIPVDTVASLPPPRLSVLNFPAIFLSPLIWLPLADEVLSDACSAFSYLSRAHANALAASTRPTSDNYVLILGSLQPTHFVHVSNLAMNHSLTLLLCMC